jgi:hypothetical protein
MSGEVLLLLMIGAIFFASVLVIAPKWLALSLWPVLMVYPHALTFGMLPLNIGFDDLYITLVFVALMIRLGFPKFSFPLKVVLVFYLILLISDLTGIVTTPIDITKNVFRASLKNLGLIMFTLVILTSVRKEKDIYRHIVSFIVSMIAASAVAIIDYFNVPFARLFYLVQEGELHFRATGSFLSPGGLGVATQIPLFISIVGLTVKSKYFHKVLFGVGAVVIGLALFFSGTRSGWVGLFLGLFVMFFTTRRKIVLIIAGILVVLIASYSIGARVRQEVIRMNVERTIYPAGSITASRYELLVDYLKHPYLGMLFCGRGEVATFAIRADMPHNGYLDAIFLYGLGGALFFGITLYRLTRLSKWLAVNDYDSLLSVIAQGIFIGIIGWFGVAMTSDILFNTFWRYTFLFLISLLWSRQEMLQGIGMLVPYLSKHVYIGEEPYEYANEDYYSDYA